MVVVVVSVVGGSLPIRASRKWLCHGGSISAPLGYIIIGLVLNSINFSRDRPILERQLAAGRAAPGEPCCATSWGVQSQRDWRDTERG
jgi:hypothetical protein